MKRLLIPIIILILVLISISVNTKKNEKLVADNNLLLNNRQIEMVNEYGFALSRRDYVLKFCSGYIELGRHINELENIAKEMGFSNSAELELLTRRTNKYEKNYAVLVQNTLPSEKYCEQIKGRLVKKKNYISESITWSNADYNMFYMGSSLYSAPLEFCKHIFLDKTFYMAMANAHGLGIKSDASLNNLIKNMKRTDIYLSQVKKYEKIINNSSREIFCNSIAKKKIYKIK